MPNFSPMPMRYVALSGVLCTATTGGEGTAENMGVFEG